ncbi:MAG: hypothetical protein KC442_17145 [Thermomicrobiales bacterium]|nr:hypothetical protein [Thermomicrobiales bacterium]
MLRLHWLFLINVIFVTLAALPLIFAYPAVFGLLGISSLENGFFVQVTGACLLMEGFASLMVWQRPLGNSDLVLSIISIKVAYILVVIAAMLSGSLPAQAFAVGAIIDALFCIGFIAFLRADRTRP